MGLGLDVESYFSMERKEIIIIDSIKTLGWIGCMDGWMAEWLDGGMEGWKDARTF